MRCGKRKASRSPRERRDSSRLHIAPRRAASMIQHQTLAIGIAMGLTSALAAQTTQPAAATVPATQSAAKAPRRQPDDPRILWTVSTDAPSFGSAAAGDIDGDGKPEIVFGTYFNDSHLYAVNAEDGS